MLKSIFKIGSLFLGLLFLFSLKSLNETNNAFYQSSHNQIHNADTLYYPGIESNERLIRHGAYQFVYDEDHEQAKWVFYKLTPSMINGPYERRNDFREDPLVLSGTATNDDYRGSGYDRGHLMPAADMAWSAASMSESFFYSNMSPQAPSFNRGVWKRLENRVRKWALEYDSLYVITGPVLDSELNFIGTNHISIPEYYFKVVLRFKNESKESIGFLMPNEASKSELIEFAFSIDSIEQVSNIDFFKSLNDSTENQLEREVDTGIWTW